MLSRIPVSLGFLLATAVLFGLQAIPLIGIFLMFMLAMFWSILLVNAAMIGTAIEAVIGRVSRLWLLLPLTFYGGYAAFAVKDHQALQSLQASYDAANAAVSIPFDASRHSLAFMGNGDGSWLSQNFALPVSYSTRADFPEGYLSHRMVDQVICADVRDSKVLHAAFVHTFGFHDGDSIGDRHFEKRFCTLIMPEVPEHPLVQVSTRQEELSEGTLPIRRETTTVTMPDGTVYELLGGVASPLKWFPMPVLGCTLNSGAPSWDCSAGFTRNGFTPIVSGNTRYLRDSLTLAKALGLKEVTPSKRRAIDSGFLKVKFNAIEQSTLERQLANIDAMIADPLAKVVDWRVDVVGNRPDALISRADAIMTGVERAAAVTGNDRGRAREGGRILARLLADLPRDKFVAFGPRILALFAAVGDEHWLWEAETVIRRLSDLGTDALPYLLRPQAVAPQINGAALEALCRLGPAARPAAEASLLAMWQSERGDRYRAEQYVAMRRMGFTPPPLPEKEQKTYQRVVTDWADISPSSPPRVCATDAEANARRQEKGGGVRTLNLE
jgi:hypothetical protein